MRTDHLDLKGLKNLAVKLAGLCHEGDVLFLRGDLGAGKTQFAKFFIQSRLGADTDVPSPTFTIVQTYDDTDADTEIWHFDLYRIEGENEIEAIGFDEARQYGISLVEWPDRLGRHAPAQYLNIHIGINADETRSVELEPIGRHWQNRLSPEKKENDGTEN